jgi:hypothetical protein
MARRSWKNVRPNSLRHAMELCIEHAEQKKNLSKERVSDLMGLSSHWVFYKWLKDGRMPSNLIRPFEHVCGVDFMTQYLAASSHKLLISMPTGHGCGAIEINDLQASFSEAISLLIRFYQSQEKVDETLASLTGLMQDIAFHRENVNRVISPELELFGGEE